MTQPSTDQTTGSSITPATADTRPRLSLAQATEIASLYRQANEAYSKGRAARGLATGVLIGAVIVSLVHAATYLGLHGHQDLSVLNAVYGGFMGFVIILLLVAFLGYESAIRSHVVIGQHMVDEAAAVVTAFEAADNASLGIKPPPLIPAHPETMM